MLASVDDVQPAAPHNVANALGRRRSPARTALRRTRHGTVCVRSDPIRTGSRTWPRSTAFATSTTPRRRIHAAAASLAAYSLRRLDRGWPREGASFDELVRGAAARLRGAVLLGQDRTIVGGGIATTRAGCAGHRSRRPETGEVTVETVMASVVQHARRLAHSGDTVLLAPACASMDMFSNYGERGDVFAARRTPYGRRLDGASSMTSYSDDRRRGRRTPATSERPLTSYYLVLGCTAMLSILGLVMVWSASFVWSWEKTGSAFTVLQKQSLYAAIGIVLLIAGAKPCAGGDASPTLRCSSSWCC